MNRVKVGAAAVAMVSVAGLLAGCGKDASKEDSPVAFTPITGDQFTSNPGAFQTDGVAAPPRDVTMVGDPIPAQAAVNAGLPQGTITSTSGNTTVYYPPAPPVPGLAVAPQPAPPAPLSRPVNTRPWQYTPQQIDAFRAICETGRWGSWIAGVQAQTQTCWTLYGRQLGVRPWTPDQPRPWLRPSYPRPWFDPGFRADVPVIWVYPRNWTRPRPQPIISVSITINLGSNPYRRINPRYPDPFFPVWAVTPGRVVDVRDQARILAPVYTATTTTTTTTTTVSAPVAPGVVLEPLPSSATVAPLLALPGQAVPGNVNTDPAVTAPVAAALDGATVRAGSRAGLEAAIGTSVSVAVASPTTTTADRTGTAATTTSGAAATPGTATTGAGTPGAPTSGAPASGAPASGAPAAPEGSTVPPTGAPATTAAPTEAATSPAPTATVAPVPTTVPRVTTQPPVVTQPTVVTQAPVTTQPPVTTQAPAVTQEPVITPPRTTQPPAVVTPTTTLAPVPTTVAPTPVAPKPVAPKPVAPKPTAAVTTTTPPPAN